ncbi:MAG: type II toxin-antitoxin system VapC family toxin [Pseudomonadota bacterium]|nr:type II toxin-antitoxin system VapC family toxin [Pseudomonadota bacterium]
MIGLDTNTLIRFLTRDDPVRANLVNQRFDRLSESGDRCYINAITLCEMLWVLRSSYGYRGPQLLHTVSMLLSSDMFELEESALMVDILERSQNTKVGIADLLIALRNRHAGCSTTLTFDKQAAKLDEFTLLA